MNDTTVLQKPTENLFAVVTGGASGLGLGISRYLVQAGYDVLACGRSQSSLEAARRELPDLKTLRVDVTNSVHCDRLFEQVLDTGKPLDLLVNNAGVSFACDYTSDLTLSVDCARTEIETNLAAPIELTRRFLWLRRQRGWEERPATIAMIGTPGGLFPMEPNSLYSTTKAGLHMYTMCLRRQLADTAVTVVENFPPLLETKLNTGHEVPGGTLTGEHGVNEWARITVDGIVAGEPNVFPDGLDFIADIIEMVESQADLVKPRIARSENWEETVRQRMF